jgi:hypothetical protein
MIRTLNMRRTAKRGHKWLKHGYQRNISTTRTWPIRKSLELALNKIPILGSASQETFARALILRTAQWALDCRRDVPSVAQFRERIVAVLAEMIEGAEAYRDATMGRDHTNSPDDPRQRTVILNRSAVGLEKDPVIAAYGPPKLVLTSPPYPGVHVVYHGWQVLGRRETPAPFWIANTLDGNTPSYYTFGDRKYPRLKTYFDAARAAFNSLSRVAGQTRCLFKYLRSLIPLGSWGNI